MLLALVCAAGTNASANIAGGLQWFGFYSADLSVTAPYSNLFQANSVADAQAAHTLGQTSLLLTFDLGA